jgi:hypothetical protein
MLETGKERAILTKSYEIAYALFRIAGQIQEKDFSEKLRVLGAGLLEMAAGENYTDASQSLQIIECLIKFAGDVNIISSANSNILLGEIYTLETAIIEYNNAAKDDRINLADIFSKEDPEVVPPATISVSGNPAIAEPKPIAKPFAKREPHNETQANLSSAIRQSAILDKIRQSGNCRLKDIQEVVPGSSERTIRYDLQSLVEKNIIERVGNGGPSVFYRLHQMA